MFTRLMLATLSLALSLGGIIILYGTYAMALQGDPGLDPAGAFGLLVGLMAASGALTLISGLVCLVATFGAGGR